MDIRIGQGYDSHRFARGRRLVLCGETLPFKLGLAGHSDADAPVHALIDALLGALALDDIGQLFPDTEPQWKNADSLELLRQVLSLPAFSGWEIGNADLTIITQKPKLAPHIKLMRRNLARTLNVEPGRVSVKAKTAEGMGPVGRLEGLEAHAVVLLNRKNTRTKENK